MAAIADAHGGRVGLRETPGGGATFSVELPTEPFPGQDSWGSAEEAGANGDAPSRAPFSGGAVRTPWS